MKYDWLDEFLLDMAGTKKDFKEEWQWTRYMIGDKLYAAICKDAKGERDIITIKLSPLDGDFLRSQYKDIIPGHYMNKVHWNSVYLDGEVSDDMLRELIEKSYHLVLSGLSKKRQLEIKKSFSCCGTDCSSYYCYGTMCKGCNESKGIVFHCESGKECNIYHCCRIKHQYQSCAECEQLPCEIWRATRDPKFSDEEFEKNIQERIGNMKKLS